ncbi:hypothetical protein ATER59S_02910 [Aquamicrobium terrae]
MLQRNKQPFVLFQRAGTRNWSMRFSMGGQQIRKSLGTEDEIEAQRLATEIWHEANYRNKNGLLPQAKPFAVVAEEFIDHVAKESARGERSPYHPQHWPPVIRRYFVGFFGNRRTKQWRRPNTSRPRTGANGRKAIEFAKDKNAIEVGSWARCRLSSTR